MPWLLDGNNLARGRERETVRRAALDLARREKVRILVFFDGAPPPGSSDVERLGPVEVRYVANADGAIAAVLRGKGRGWRVATDDRELGRRAVAAGAEVVAGRAFWRKAESVGLERGLPGGTGAAAADLDDLARSVERLPDAPARVPHRRRRR